METEYDKARNPKGNKDPDYIHRLSTDEYPGILKRVIELEKRVEDDLQFVHGWLTNLERLCVTPASPSPASSPKPSQAWNPDWEAIKTTQDIEQEGEELHEEIIQPNILLSIESCLEDIKDRMDRQETLNAQRDGNQERRHAEIMRVLEQIKEQINAKPTIKEAEKLPEQATEDSEHFACKRCSWRMPLNYHRYTAVMAGTHTSGMVRCPSCESSKGWDRIGRNRDTVNNPEWNSKGIIL